MKKNTVKFWLMTVIIFVAVTDPLFAQESRPAKSFTSKAAYYNYLAKERGYKKIEASLNKPAGPEHRKRSIFNVGNVTTRIRNSATLGYEKTDGLCYEFPSGSGITYRWTMAPLVGAIVNGQKRVACGTLGAARQHEDEFEPIGGLDAGWSDEDGNYGIAASDRPDTWPAAWPTDDPYMPAIGSNNFPGILNGEVVATREMYFAVTDQGDYQNDTLNIRIDIWGIQYEDFINEDFIIYKMIVTNIGEEILNDVFIGMHDDPDTPEQGDGEWTDDFAAFIPKGTDVEGYVESEDSLLWNFTYLWDGDDKAEGFIASKVGWVGLKVLETPEDPDNPGSPMGLTTLDVFAYSNAPQSPLAEYDQLASGIKPPDNVAPHSDDWTQTPNTWGPDITYAIASGPFELKPGESLNFAMASVHGVNKKDLFNNAMLCQTLYNNDYASAEAPPVPNVRAIAGDHSVKLYWDAFPTEYAMYPDGHVGDKLTGNNAFEGYKIYKSTDRGLNWGEAMIDINGTPRGFIPLAQYDVINGIQGESESRPFFYLGDDTGLKHTFTDQNVENGFEYWYAVLAYDRDDGPIPPLDNAFKKNADSPGDNVVAVIPKGTVGGFKPASADSFTTHTSGISDISSFPIEIIDPGAITGDNYEISFKDSSEGKFFTITNLATGQVTQTGVQAVENWPFYNEEIDNAPIFDGVSIKITDVDPGFKDAYWTIGNSDAVIEEFGYYDYGTTDDYEIRWTETLGDSGAFGAPPLPFEIHNLTQNGQCDHYMWDNDGTVDYTPGDDVLFIEPDGAFTWIIEIDESGSMPPVAGDIATIVTFKPISENDKYQFSTSKQSYASVTETDLQKITTVPNPYVVSSRFEIGAFGLEKNVQFHFLPPSCTIRIFNIAGDLVQTIDHTNETSIENWNLQSRNGQEVAFGVYFYHIDAPGIGEYIGKMALIK